MNRQTRSRMCAASRRKTGGHIATVFAAALSLTACQSQFQQPSDLLFAPTYSLGPEAVPKPWDTKYDCRAFQGPGWKGITGGIVEDLDRRWPISQAACFKTESECRAYLTVMRGYIDIPHHFSCRPITA